MTFWIIVAAVVVVGFALAWWTSGRAKPETGRRSMQDSIDIGKAETRSNAKGGGDGGNSIGFSLGGQ
ncbi:hypothetical protein ABIE44_002819 [Marmoricola sp. OAE513]|uniref:hypothetical protein n=1 Tax=Marmoricola sp. OAE513 TaxID=2817894 RepID=UPI001AE824B6